MITRVILAALLPLCAAAQLQTFAVAGGAMTPLGTLHDLGSAAPGDTIVARFWVRNSTAAPASLVTLGVAGTGFALAGYPPLPYTLAPSATVDFTVRFAPTATGGFSASLAVNGVVTLLRGTGLAAATVFLEGEDGSPELLRTGATIDFGRIERNSSSAHRVRLGNHSGERLRIATIRVQGPSFRGPIGVNAPLWLENGRSAVFEVYFEPRTAGPDNGTLDIDGRRFPLLGTGLEIPFPAISIRTEPGAMQVRLRIELEAPARRAGAGEVSLELRSAAGFDPTVFFLPVSSRFAPFTVKEGDTRARFGDREEIVFQTGTTAGTLLLTARLAEQSDQVTIPIAPAKVEFESVKALRSGSQIEVQIVGYDNTRTAAQLAFTFYDAKDAAVSPGSIQLDAGADFRRYFENSTTGGAFSLRAVFPVAGRIADIVSVEVELANSQGATRSGRLRLP
ncbi:MAG: choice-of-anchor D domain-containing protein [Acidobacteria bacterium]|nr:choice-of-anchor D domain-containing protein [Acidobacteriota bacterium]